MIKHLTTPAKNTLLKALNKLWEASVYPEQWSKEIKLPFLKPGKDPHLPSSYRPISLTSCICKLFERMVNHRLMWFLEKNNILCPEQSGFRKHRSTIDALTQLTCHIEKGFKEKKHTVAVFFDTVWRPEILNYMHEMGLRGNLPAFAEGFLSSREFCVRVGASHSEYFVQEGLPQGNVLSVTNFCYRHQRNHKTALVRGALHSICGRLYHFCLSSHHNPFNQDYSNCHQQPRTVDKNQRHEILN